MRSIETVSYIVSSVSFVHSVNVVPTQPLSLVQMEVIQMDVKESLEGLKTFVWFRAEVCIPPWRCLGNRLVGITLLCALILS